MRTTAPGASLLSRGTLMGRSGLAQLAPLSGLVVLLILAAVITPSFFSAGNLNNVTRQAAILGMVVIGQTLVLLTGGLDLSVGAVMGIAMIVAAQVTGGHDDRVPAAVALAFALGVAIGLANAFLVVRRRVPPFVATLATLILIEGARTAWTRGIPSGSLPSVLRSIGGASLGPVPTPLIITAAVAVVMWFTLARTTYGRSIFALGSNPRAASMSGLPVGLLTGSVYILSSLLAILAGLMLSGYVGYVDQYIGEGYELNSIAAAVVGGTSLAGGQGGVGGAIIGTILMAALFNVAVLANAGAAGQLIIQGLVIIFAVALQGRTALLSRVRVK